MQRNGNTFWEKWVFVVGTGVLTGLLVVAALPTLLTTTCVSTSPLLLSLGSQMQTRKKNIVTISNSLEMVNALRGVTFNWLGEDADDQPHLGFVAQEVEQILPSLVSTNSQGIKSVNYLGFAPILANAIGEQQFQLADLTGLQETQQSSLSQMVEQIAQLVHDVLALSSRVSNLEQALPNVTQSWQWINDQYHFLVRIVMDKTPVLADEDAAGFIVIKSGASEATVIFSQPLPYLPIVSVTAMDSASTYFVTNVSETSFTLKLPGNAEQDKRFSWAITLASQVKTTESSSGQAANPSVTTSPDQVPPVTTTPPATPSVTATPTPTGNPQTTQTPSPTSATPTQPPQVTATPPAVATPEPTSNPQVTDTPTTPEPTTL